MKLDNTLHAERNVSRYPQEFCLVRRALSSLLPVLVYQGVKGQAILPAGGEVGDIDVGVAASKRNIKT